MCLNVVLKKNCCDVIVFRTAFSKARIKPHTHKSKYFHLFFISIIFLEAVNIIYYIIYCFLVLTFLNNIHEAN